VEGNVTWNESVSYDRVIFYHEETGTCCCSWNTTTMTTSDCGNVDSFHGDDRHCCRTSDWMYCYRKTGWNRKKSCCKRTGWNRNCARSHY